MARAIKPNEVMLRIPSRLEMLDVVDRVTAAIAEYLEFAEDEAHGVANSVLEAGTNAIQHGHFNDADLPVDIVYQIGIDALRVQVHDQGPGFDIQRVLHSDPTSPAGILAQRGRGIYIMKSLMDEVSFRVDPGKGCTAILTKFYKPEP
jgi:serine/threonine-protein kinase RsbW